MSKYNFNPIKHQLTIIPLLKDLLKVDLSNPKTYHQILKKHPKPKGRMYSKSEIIAALRYFYPKKSNLLITKISKKPTRTISGVVPITLLTKPYPCPGNCIFCPNDPVMPKSYLSSEPGAQRAASNGFDPYHQVTARLYAYHANGHSTDKAELIVLGGSWSAYPLPYKTWFIKRCFDALNNFNPKTKANLKNPHISGSSTWEELKKSQKTNQTAETRCVGLSLETRPDLISSSQVLELRRFGATKIQIGLQSLNNKILKLNRRGHDLKSSRQAIKLLRLAGFKIQAHWMANLYGSSLEKDIHDFAKMFSDPSFRPDELKIYPTALIKSAPLMEFYKSGKWKPFTSQQLLDLLINILPTIPAYCRVSRVIRDFSAHDIVAGSKTSNLRQILNQHFIDNNQSIQEIRSREIKGDTITQKDLTLKVVSYQTSVSQEKFIQFVTLENKIAGFLRLSLPKTPSFIEELSKSCIIRELHVYGQALDIGGKAKTQHLGLGKKLISKAIQLAKINHFNTLSVISAIGTKEYYSKRGFIDGKLYQHLHL